MVKLLHSQPRVSPDTSGPIPYSVLASPSLTVTHHCQKADNVKKLKKISGPITFLEEKALHLKHSLIITFFL